jgi:hypothetical protein
MSSNHLLHAFCMQFSLSRGPCVWNGTWSSSKRGSCVWNGTGWSSSVLGSGTKSSKRVSELVGNVRNCIVGCVGSCGLSFEVHAGWERQGLQREGETQSGVLSHSQEDSQVATIRWGCAPSFWIISLKMYRPGLSYCLATCIWRQRHTSCWVLVSQERENVFSLSHSMSKHEF